MKLFLYVDICKDNSSSPSLCLYNIYSLGLIIKCDNSLAIVLVKKKVFLTFNYHLIEIILNNLSGVLASLEVAVF